MKLELSYKIKSRLISYNPSGEPYEFYTLYVYKGEKMPSSFQRFFGKPSTPIWDEIEEYGSLDRCKDALRDDALHRYQRYFYNQNESSYVSKEYSVWITVEDGKVGPVILSNKL
jgi:hypothetical protein